MLKKHDVKALTDANPTHMILKPGKWNGALSERNKAGKQFGFISFDSSTGLIIFFSTKMKSHSPVKGEKIKGEMTLAKELRPEMHP